MDTQKLIQDAKARFRHNESKLYLQEKYKNKLTFANSGGMWTASPELISFLSLAPDEVILKDNFGNPVKVVARELKDEAWKIYHAVMSDWYREYNNLQGLR